MVLPELVIKVVVRPPESVDVPVISRLPDPMMLLVTVRVLPIVSPPINVDVAVDEVA